MIFKVRPYKKFQFHKSLETQSSRLKKYIRLGKLYSLYQFYAKRRLLCPSFWDKLSFAEWNISFSRVNEHLYNYVCNFFSKYLLSNKRRYQNQYLIKRRVEKINDRKNNQFSFWVLHWIVVNIYFWHNKLSGS